MSWQGAEEKLALTKSHGGGKNKRSNLSLWVNSVQIYATATMRKEFLSKITLLRCYDAQVKLGIKINLSKLYCFFLHSLYPKMTPNQQIKIVNLFVFQGLPSIISTITTLLLFCPTTSTTTCPIWATLTSHSHTQALQAPQNQQVSILPSHVWPVTPPSPLFPPQPRAPQVLWMRRRVLAAMRASTSPLLPLSIPTCGPHTRSPYFLWLMSSLWPWAWHSLSSLPRACPPRGCPPFQASTPSYPRTCPHSQGTTPSTHSITRTHQWKSLTLHLERQLRTTSTTAMRLHYKWMVFLRVDPQAGRMLSLPLPCLPLLHRLLRSLCSRSDPPVPPTWPRRTVSTVMWPHSVPSFQPRLCPVQKSPVQTPRQIFPHHPQKAQKTLWVTISYFYVRIYTSWDSFTAMLCVNKLKLTWLFD